MIIAVVRRLRMLLPALVILAAGGCGAHHPSGAQDGPFAPEPVSGGAGLQQSPTSDPDGNPPCPAEDQWRHDPGGVGIAVTYRNAGSVPSHVRVVVRQRVPMDLSQVIDLNPGERTHEFDFIDVDPTTVTEVLISTGAGPCVVSAAPHPGIR